MARSFAIPRDHTTKAEWHLTYRCDLGCTHCNRAAWMRVPHTPDMSLADAEEFCRQARELNWQPRILLIGGEPTLHRDFLEFAQLAREFSGASGVAVWSNGRSEHAQAQLAAVAGFAGIITSGQKDASVVHCYDDYFLAPADMRRDREPCQHHISCGSHGMCVDSLGYALCCTSGTIDSLLHLGIRTRVLADLFDEQWAAWHVQEMCRWCGHLAKGRAPVAGHVHGTPVSITWLRAFEQHLGQNSKEIRREQRVRRRT